MRPFLALLLPLLMVTGCVTPFMQQEEVRSVPLPTGWKAIELANVAFWLPPDVMETEVQGIDSLVRQYKGADIEVNIDYGRYSSDLREFESRAEGSSEWVRTQGRRARVLSGVVEGRFVDAIHYPQAGSGNQRLTMVIFSDSTTARVHAESILKSLRFAR